MLKTFIAVGIFIAGNTALIYIPTVVPALQATPDHAKWGQLAIKKAQSKYPSANIVDYLHEGNESKHDSTIEKFKLWLKDGDHEFGVFVRIEYSTITEKVVNIELQETSK